MSRGWDSRDPFSCMHCGVAAQDHGQRWTDGVGVHQWQRPTQITIKARMYLRSVNPNRWVPNDGRTSWRKW